MAEKITLSTDWGIKSARKSIRLRNNQHTHSQTLLDYRLQGKKNANVTCVDETSDFLPALSVGQQHSRQPNRTRKTQSTGRRIPVQPPWWRSHAVEGSKIPNSMRLLLSCNMVRGHDQKNAWSLLAGNERTLDLHVRETRHLSFTMSDQTVADALWRYINRMDLLTFFRKQKNLTSVLAF